MHDEPDEQTTILVQVHRIHVLETGNVSDYNFSFLHAFKNDVKRLLFTRTRQF